jgi:hypothetical protein
MVSQKINIRGLEKTGLRVVLALLMQSSRPKAVDLTVKPDPGNAGGGKPHKEPSGFQAAFLFGRCGLALLDNPFFQQSFRGLR